MVGANTELASRVPRRTGGRTLMALGMALARRGVMPAVAMAICAGTVIVVAALAVLLVAKSAAPPLWDVPLLASSALAWGGGFLLAFAAAAHALRRDRAEGLRDLLVARTTSLRAYLAARVGGLAALLAIWVAGGTLACGVVAALAAAKIGVLSRTLGATAAAVVYAVAFAAVIAPVAFAALGARSRVGGYLFLLVVVVLPEVIAEALADVLPYGVAEVLAIPSALGALRGGLTPGGLDPLRVVRALVALALFAAFAMVVVRRDAILLERREGDA